MQQGVLDLHFNVLYLFISSALVFIMGASVSSLAPNIQAESAMSAPHFSGVSPPPGCPMHQESPKSELYSICYHELISGLYVIIRNVQYKPRLSAS